MTAHRCRPAVMSTRAALPVKRRPVMVSVGAVAPGASSPVEAVVVKGAFPPMPSTAVVEGVAAGVSAATATTVGGDAATTSRASGSAGNWKSARGPLRRGTNRTIVRSVPWACGNNQGTTPQGGE